jgi:hypothetical protein
LSIYTVLHEIVLYTIYKASVSPGPVQQIMPVRTSQETHYFSLTG